MRCLRFMVGARDLAVDLSWVREVCPVVRLRAMPGAPEWLRGLMDHHGVLVPVLDLGLLLGGSAVEPLVGARILLLEGPIDGSHDARHTLFGALVDAVDAPATLDRDGSWSAPGDLPVMPFVGEVARVGAQPVFVMDAGRLALHHAGLPRQSAPTRALTDDSR